MTCDLKSGSCSGLALHSFYYKRFGKFARRYVVCFECLQALLKFKKNGGKL